MTRSFKNGTTVRFNEFEDEKINEMIKSDPFRWATRSDFTRAAVAFFIRHLEQERAAKNSLKHQ